MVARPAVDLLGAGYSSERLQNKFYIVNAKCMSRRPAIDLTSRQPKYF